MCVHSLNYMLLYTNILLVSMSLEIVFDLEIDDVDKVLFRYAHCSFTSVGEFFLRSAACISVTMVTKCTREVYTYQRRLK